MAVTGEDCVYPRKEVDVNDDIWLTRQEVADREKLPSATLAQWGSQGKGPRYARFGRHVRYRLSDVIAWENAQFSNDDSLQGSGDETARKAAVRARIAELEGAP